MIPRHAEDTIRQMKDAFGALLITGAYQTGKRTLLQTISNDNNYFHLEDPNILQVAPKEMKNFFRHCHLPISISEIQSAPNLLNFVQSEIQQAQKKGLFCLSSSNPSPIQDTIEENIEAKRLRKFHLLGISLRERGQLPFLPPFIPAEPYFQERRRYRSRLSYSDIWPMIHRGCLPDLVAQPTTQWAEFYSNYIKQNLTNLIRAEGLQQELFLHFMKALAKQIGQPLDLGTIGRELELHLPTLTNWLIILENAHLVYLLPPHPNAESGETFQAARVYFLDTGLASYLAGWNSPEELKQGTAADYFFKNFVIADIIKSYTNAGVIDLPLYFYPNTEGVDIDLLILQSGKLHPIIIRNHASPQQEEIAHFDLIDSCTDTERGTGCIICFYEQFVSFSNQDKVVPLHYL